MAGLSEAEALQTATINPAKYMDQEDQMGSIEVNKSADLVLLNSNPLENIRNTRDIHKVIFKNQILNPDSLLQDVKIFNKDLMRKIAAQKERSK
jgi:imidazolonepropionase-like amidohydrolase